MVLWRWRAQRLRRSLGVKLASAPTRVQALNSESVTSSLCFFSVSMCRVDCAAFYMESHHASHLRPHRSCLAQSAAPSLEARNTSRSRSNCCSPVSGSDARSVCCRSRSATAFFAYMPGKKGKGGTQRDRACNTRDINNGTAATAKWHPCLFSLTPTEITHDGVGLGVQSTLCLGSIDLSRRSRCAGQGCSVRSRHKRWSLGGTILEVAAADAWLAHDSCWQVCA